MPEGKYRGCINIKKSLSFPNGKFGHAHNCDAYDHHKYDYIPEEPCCDKAKMWDLLYNRYISLTPEETKHPLVKLFKELKDRGFECEYYTY